MQLVLNLKKSKISSSRNRYNFSLNNAKVVFKLLRRLTVLYVTEDYWIASRGYWLFKYDLINQEWSYFAKLADQQNTFLSLFFLTKRLFRAEVTHLYKFNENLWMCIAKKGIFRLTEESARFQKCYSIERGSHTMSLCQDKNGIIYFGEYFGNVQKLPVHIFKSADNGETWETAFTFPHGSINHIHGIFRDPFTDRLWVATGDLDDECIIGYSEDGFKTFVPQYRGSQKFRACNLLFYRDKIVFATDSQYEQNVIRSLDRCTGEIKDLCKIQGSGIYSGQIGDFAFISTTVEPSRVNLDQNSYLWISYDGDKWNQILHFEKDIYEKRLFQFGSIRFPNYENISNISQLIITGRALKKIDGHSLAIPFETLKDLK